MGKEVNASIIHNTIVNGTRIEGTITCTHDIRIDGELQGDLNCQGKVVIGESGIIKGNVNCNSAEISGNIEGKITTHDALSLRNTAKMQGEIQTKTLAIEPGAQFNGSCKMMGNVENK